MCTRKPMKMSSSYFQCKTLWFLRLQALVIRRIKASLCGPVPFGAEVLLEGEELEAPRRVGRETALPYRQRVSPHGGCQGDTVSSCLGEEQGAGQWCELQVRVLTRGKGAIRQGSRSQSSRLLGKTGGLPVLKVFFSQRHWAGCRVTHLFWFPSTEHFTSGEHSWSWESWYD